MARAGIHQQAFTLEDAAALRRRFLAMGLLAVALGAAAIALPLTTALPVTAVLGLALMTIGVADTFHAFLLRSRHGFLLSWLSALLFFFTGLLVLLAPAAQLTSLPHLLAVAFILGGALRMGKGVNLQPVGNWPWVVLSGALGLVFGFYILTAWRTIDLTTISVLAGISLVVDGGSRMALFWLCERPGGGGARRGP